MKRFWLLSLCVMTSISIVYSENLTKTSDCELYKNPDTDFVEKNFHCVHQQDLAYHSARRDKNIEEAAKQALWSYIEAWVWNDAAFNLIKNKKPAEISKEDLLKAEEYYPRAIEACQKALEVRIGIRDATECNRYAQKGLLFVERCLGKEPWPKKEIKNKGKGGK